MLTPAGPSPPIRRENPPIREIGATRRLLARSGRHGPGRRPAGRLVRLGKECNLSTNLPFRNEDPKGRTRKERCSSGLYDPSRPTANGITWIRALPATGLEGNRTWVVTGRFRVKTREYLPLQPCAFQHCRPGFAWIAHPRRPSGLRLSSPCALTSLPSGCAAFTRPGASVPCLSHIASQRVVRGVRSDWRLYRPAADGPPPAPTHALGSRPSPESCHCCAEQNDFMQPESLPMGPHFGCSD